MRSSRSSRKNASGDGIPRAVRREVFERDGEQCTFTDDRGNRCPARADLEIDHIVPRARGGTNDAENLRVVCRAHNKLYAEQAFGRAHVEEQIHRRQRMSDTRRARRVDVARRALDEPRVPSIGRDARSQRACCRTARRHHRCRSSFEPPSVCSRLELLASVVSRITKGRRSIPAGCRSTLLPAKMRRMCVSPYRIRSVPAVEVARDSSARHIPVEPPDETRMTRGSRNRPKGRAWTPSRIGRHYGSCSLGHASQ